MGYQYMHIYQLFTVFQHKKGLAHYKDQQNSSLKIRILRILKISKNSRILYN